MSYYDSDGSESTNHWATTTQMSVRCTDHWATTTQMAVRCTDHWATTTQMAVKAITIELLRLRWQWDALTIELLRLRWQWDALMFSLLWYDLFCNHFSFKHFAPVVSSIPKWLIKVIKEKNRISNKIDNRALSWTFYDFFKIVILNWNCQIKNSASFLRFSNSSLQFFKLIYGFYHLFKAAFTHCD